MDIKATHMLALCLKLTHRYYNRDSSVQGSYLLPWYPDRKMGWFLLNDADKRRDRLSARSSFPAGALSYQFTIIPVHELEVMIIISESAIITIVSAIRAGSSSYCLQQWNKRRRLVTDNRVHVHLEKSGNKWRFRLIERTKEIKGKRPFFKVEL